MTLIDTAPGIGAVLAALGDELGVEFAVAGLTAALGPPLHHVFADYLPGEQIPAAVDRFRALYPSLAIEPVELMPGAAQAIAAVRRHGGRVVVVTGKHGPNAQLHLDHLGVDLDHLGGGVWGLGKADVLRAEGVSIYVGDHVHDIAGARGADALSVSVLTGGSSEAELRAAGTDVVLDSLDEFPAWLDQHLG
jgi:phosphoglycolate phosphatase-like HAD superfamily hydrolase